MGKTLSIKLFLNLKLILLTCRSDSLDCARLLIDAERDCVNYTDFLGRTSLHLAAVKSKDEKFIKLLLENGADVNARCHLYSHSVLTTMVKMVFGRSF